MTRSRPAILAIDDTPANLELLIGALMVDFDLQIATSGAQGLDYASQSSPDLILLDVRIPDCAGRCPV
jgi:PleD family two-component response regulator